MKIKCRIEGCKSEIEMPNGTVNAIYLCSHHTDEELGITSRPDKDIHFQQYAHDPFFKPRKEQKDIPFEENEFSDNR